MKSIKRFAKKILALATTLALIVATTINANAAAQTIQLGQGSYTGSYIAGVRFHYKQTTGGTLLYCLDIHKVYAANATAHLVNPSSKINGGIVYILKNGYPEKSIIGDKDKDYYITQSAVWWYLDETTGSHNLGDQFKSTGADPYGLRPKIKNLVTAGVAHKNDSYGISTLNFSMNTSDLNMTQSGNYFVSQSIKGSGSSSYATYTVTLDGAPSGTIIEYNGTTTTNKTVTLNNGTSFKIKVPKESVTSDLSIKVSATTPKVTQYAAYEYQAENQNMQPLALLEKSVQSGSASLTLKVLTTSVSIIKIDSSTNKPLANAILVLKDANGKEVKKWRTTTSAQVINNIPYGNYTVEEVKQPEGYKLNTTPVKITISKSNRHVEVKFKNEPEKIVVTITKIDSSTKGILPGAELIIKDKSGKEVYKFTSKETAEVITSLKKGTYTIEETSAPAGYIKSDKVVKFTIDSEHLSHQIEFDNEPTYVSITKVDASTGKPIADATLVLKDANGKEIKTWRTTTSARVFRKLPIGTYTVEELEAPEGYKLDKTPTTFTVSEKNAKVELKIKNEAERIVVNITKVDQETQKPLEGAIFIIKDINGNEVYRFTSSTSSEVITTLGKGTYSVEEIKAPEGYIKSDRIVTFTIDSEHLSHQIIFENAKETPVPDTASETSILLMILGIAIVGFGLCFVNENKQKA